MSLLDKRRNIFLIVCLLWVANAFSQEFAAHWIAYPLPNDSSEVLFQHTYVSPRPQQANITMASTGRLKLFVNGRNVMRDIYLTNRATNSITFHTYDVTRFLRPDSNIIVVWYAPDTKPLAGKQLSLEYYGIDHRGKRFYNKADQTWLCKKQDGAFLKDGVESFDGRRSMHGRMVGIDTSHGGWVVPTGAHVTDEAVSIASIQHPTDSILAVINIIKPVAKSEGANEVVYDFGREFNGIVRVTMRNAIAGEVIYVGNLAYSCKGQMDEQCFSHFFCKKQRTVRIHGDLHFRKRQIQKVEGLEVELTPRNSLLY